MSIAAERLPVLDGLRAISILLVLACHMLPIGPKSFELNETAGAMGMSLFFALSGFLITSGLKQNLSTYEFMLRRLSKIIPLAYGYTVLVFIFLTLDPGALFWTDVFVVNYVHQYLNSYNSHFWSLCVEVQFYFAIAAAVLLAGRKGLMGVWPVCIAITAIRIGQHTYINIETHLRADEILAGACLATIFNVSWIGRVRFVVVFFCGAAALWFLSANPFTGWLQYLRPYATALLLAAALCLPDRRLSQFLSSGPLRYVATISYALYIIHPLTIHGWWNDGSAFVRYLLKRPISFAMTFATAHFATFYWEQTWTRAARQIIRKRRDALLGRVTRPTPLAT
jgi:peptidoglycan/LPS O-acetylase OafA/YrhL